MTYRLVLTYTARVNRVDAPVAEQTFHADTLAGIARLAYEIRGQFALPDCDGADIYDRGPFPLNEWPLESAVEVAEFVASFGEVAA